MMTLQCIEPQGRPTLSARSVEPGAVVALYLHPDAVDGDPGLRATVLCAPDQHPPRGAVLLLEVEVQTGGLRAVRVGEGVVVELLRAELRSRVTAGTALRCPCRLEASLPSQRRIAWTLDTPSAGAAEARAVVGSGGTRSSAALAANRGALWLIPTGWEMFTDADGIVVDNLQGLGRRLGLSTRGVLWVTLAWFTLAGAGWGFYSQTQKTSAAEERAATAEGDLALAESARKVALGSELSCLSERGALVAALGDAAARRQLQAELALAVSGAQGAAIEAGGERMGTPEVLAADAEQRARLLGEVVRQMEIRKDEVLDAGPCLAHEAALGADLPRYALLWHADPTLSCPRAFASVEGGVSLLGRWGLSGRAAREFGAPDPALERALAEAPSVDRDPRGNDRWAVAALVTGLRAVQGALLRHDGGGKVPVAPSEAQIWSLALWSAYDHMPDPIGGDANAGAATCVGLLLDDAAAEAGPGGPGQPLLPDLVAVSTGERTVAARPIPACPWPTDAVKQGVDAALAAVSRLALVSDGTPVAAGSGP